MNIYGNRKGKENTETGPKEKENTESGPKENEYVSPKKKVYQKINYITSIFNQIMNENIYADRLKNHKEN